MRPLIQTPSVDQSITALPRRLLFCIILSGTLVSKIDLHALDQLDDEYYNCPDQLPELLPKFAAANPISFKPAP